MGLAAAAPNFGKYALVVKLATGGMAEIFLARLQGAGGFEKLVCIKRILPHLAKDPQFVGMFLAEAQIAAQISHPNVCQVFELGEIDGRYFIAMEYLEGVPLSCFRRGDLYPPPLDPRLVAGLGVQACEGLHHAHNLRRADGTPFEVVHRDVSSNNLFATVDGIVKVLDFGIAKIQDASVKTSTGSVKGTYAYMSPEQLRGEPLDRRTDVFAMGIVLWELFGRRHLFKRETEFLTFQAITTDPIPEVAELRPDVPPALSAAIAKALARDRDARFPTARALGEALAQAVAPLGGPLSPAAISDEIEAAFAIRLRDQRTLIRVAREGGAFELEHDVGPAVGHGTELMSTPVSNIGGFTVNAYTDPSPSPASSPSMPSSASAGGPAQPRPVSLPMAPATRSRLPVIVLAMLAVGGIGAALYLWLHQRAVTTADDPAPIRMVAIPSDASGALPDAAIAMAVDAAAPTIPPEAAAPIPASTPDAAAPVPTIPPTAVVPPDAAPITRTRPDRRPPAAPRPTGPPGFITIDSAPVYAVIFIDGKKIGETPLVRIPVAPGKHTVKAVSAQGASRTLSITIQSGKVAPTRRIEW